MGIFEEKIDGRMIWKKIIVPYSIKDLTVKVLLLEKSSPKLSGLHFCCWLNEVPIYTDSNMERGKVLTGSKTDSVLIEKKPKFLVVGYEPEEITTDSIILQNLSVLISEVYK